MLHGVQHVCVCVSLTLYKVLGEGTVQELDLKQVSEKEGRRQQTCNMEAI